MKVSKILLMTLLSLTCSVVSANDSASLKEKMEARRQLARNNQIIEGNQRYLQGRIQIIKEIVEDKDPSILASFTEALTERENQATSEGKSIQIKELYFETSSDLICSYQEDTCTGTSCYTSADILCLDEKGNYVVSEYIDVDGTLNPSPFHLR